MLRSIFDLQTSYANSLSFKNGEKFVQLETSNDRNWILVVNDSGSVGYVPKNYVAADKVSQGSNPTPYKPLQRVYEVPESNAQFVECPVKKPLIHLKMVHLLKLAIKLRISSILDA